VSKDKQEEKKEKKRKIEVEEMEENKHPPKKSYLPILLCYSNPLTHILLPSLGHLFNAPLAIGRI
jgi:hypothetical protein